MGVRHDQRGRPLTIEELRGRRMMMEAATGRRPRRRRPRRQLLPRGQELRFRKLLLGILTTIGDRVRSEILPLLERLSEQVRQARPDARFDAPADELVDATAAIREQLASTALSDESLSLAANAIAGDVSRFNRVQTELAFEPIGVGLSAVEPGLDDVLQSFVRDNVRRIKNLADDTVNGVESSILRGFRRGVPNRQLARDIEDQLGISRRRARLIARDQTASLNGELTQIRQTRMGVKSYVWRTVGDERVRASHMDLDGQTFTWAEGSPEGHPGEPINCRCVAEPVLDPLFEGL